MAMYLFCAALADEYFNTNKAGPRTCLPKCTKEEDVQVRKFMTKFRTKYRREYNDLTLGIINRANSQDYDL